MRQIIRAAKSFNILWHPRLIRRFIRKLGKYDGESHQALIAQNVEATEARRRGTCYANLAVEAIDARIAAEQQRDHAPRHIRCLEARSRQQVIDA
ncbi:hypothetical protein OCU04_010755 [Sclerotinia nivalis]|uniref:Uncharacterized protein n=1 Tax=Sclerotinia nivalis TaxID=352851 RepID=A0A9X0ADY7_9HELO|nr:hypothetical protein OCU04_010755 [Sclerotinia nivalis]